MLGRTLGNDLLGENELDRLLANGSVAALHEELQGFQLLQAIRQPRTRAMAAMVASRKVVSFV
jgi:hypothetical protein